MRYCITGGMGFIGKILVEKLIKNKQEVVVFDKIDCDLKGTLNIKGDIRNLGDIDKIPDVDVIIHLAAISRIAKALKDPRFAYETNVLGTLNILEFAQKRGSKVIYAGSFLSYYDVYANHYGHSKWLGEEQCKLYSKLYNLSIAIVRFFNVYGKGSDSVVDVFIRQKLNNKPLIIWGDGLQKRDFVHVEDVTDVLIELSKTHCSFNKVFGIGMGENYSILEIAQMLDHYIEYISSPRLQPEETLADINLAKEVLGYNPKYSVKDYIKCQLTT